MQLFKSFLTAIVLLAYHGLFGQVVVSGELRKWHTVSLTFNGPNTSENNATNPFLDYRLNVTFNGPGGKSYTVPGFYAADGNAANTGASSGNKWMVRFTPDAPGQWTYTASFRTGSDIAINLSANAGSGTSFDGTTGSFSVSSSNKSEPDNRAKGRLNYVGQRYLKWEETGDYFLKAGADSPENLLGYSDFDNTLNSKTWEPHKKDWQSGNPTWQNGKGKGLIGAVNYLSGKGMNAFSFLTMNVTGDAKDVWPWTTAAHAELDGASGSDAANRLRYDVSKLEQWEILFNHADSKGMYLHFKTQETENDMLLDGGELGTQRKLYYRELIARFGHHLALNWNLGEENDLYDVAELKDANCSRVKSYATYFKTLDPYGHHVVIHSYPWGQDLLYTPLLGNTDLTGASIQSDITDVHDDVKRWIVASGNKGKQWVVANDEQGGANKGVAADASFSGQKGTIADNQKDVRSKVLWGTLMAGGAGVEYYFGYNTGETDLNAEDWRSRNTKWEDAKKALNFFEQHLPYWLMNTSDNLTSSTTDYCLSKTGDIYAIYLPNGGTTNLNLSGTSGAFTIKWYDPRNGGNLVNGSKTEMNGGGNTSIGNPPNNATQDWVAMIKLEEGSSGGETPDTDCEADYGSKNGLVVIEAENLQVPSGWKNKSAVSGYTGNGYLEWEGGDSFNNPGAGVISTSIKINEPGVYLFQWRNKVGFGTVSTDFNDTWLRFPDASDFYGLKGAHIVYPKGSGKTPLANGAGSGGWLKVYLSGTTNWTWSTNTSDEDPHKIYVAFDTPGVYTMEISGRSDHHVIDRITLNKSAADPTNLSLEETPCNNEPSNDISVSSVSVSPENTTLLNGDTFALSAVVLPANATNKSVVWSSSDPNMATVSQNGTVTARAEGNVTIMVKTVDGNYSDTSSITIETGVVAVSSVVVSPDQRTLVIGNNLSLEAEVLPADATNKSVSWSTSHPSVAIVDQNGSVTAVSSGQAIITATTADGNKKDTATISVENAVIPVTSVTISVPDASMTIGDTMDLTAVILPGSATNQGISWTSSNPGIAAVNASGRVSAIAQGAVTITVTTADGNRTASVSLTIESIVVPVSSITVSPAQITMLAGNSEQLSGAILPANATNKTVSWSSSQPEIATVNASGRVTALSEGATSITATTADGNKTATALISVESGDIPVSSLSISPEEATLQIGTSTTLSRTILPADATDKSMNWNSSNPSVATVNQIGRVTALSAGVVTITAVTSDGNHTDTAVITVEAGIVPVTSVVISPDTASMLEGTTLEIRAELFPSTATNPSVVWNSSDNSVATVNAQGLVTAVSLGSAIITATTEDGGFTDGASITVVSLNIPVSDIVISPDQATIIGGNFLRLTAEIFPADATNRQVIWSSSDASVATVNQNGRIAALAPGEVQISVTSADGNFTDSAAITVVLEDIFVTSVVIAPEEASLTAGSSLQLSAEVFPANATNKELTWSSSDPLVVEVNANGQITAVTEGSAIVTVTTVDGSFTASSEITIVIEAIPVTGIVLSPEQESIETGTSITFLAEVFPSAATNKELLWVSSDTAIATVNPYGKADGVSEGTVSITATTVDGQFSASVTLNVIAVAEEPTPEPTPEPEPAADCIADFIAVDNRVIIEAEHLNLNFGWAVRADDGGHSGSGYITYEGENQFNTPGSALISTSIEIREAGVYLFQWRNKIGGALNATDSNDTWLRFPDAEEFYGSKGDGPVIYPNGATKGPLPKGASLEGWFKVYQNTGMNWSWETNTSDNDPHAIYVVFSHAGVYTMEISGRSKGHMLDRIVLSKDGVDESDLTSDETPCGLPAESYAPNLQIEDGSALEGKDITFNINLSRESSEAITLEMTYSDDTADREDYEPRSLLVTIEPGEITKSVSVATRNDGTREKDEFFHVAVSGIKSGAIADYSDRGILTILDEDSPLSIYPNPASANAMVQLDGLPMGDYEIGIFTMGGERIQNRKITANGSYPLMLNHMAKGIYIVRAVSAERTFSGKMIVQ